MNIPLNLLGRGYFCFVLFCFFVRCVLGFFFFVSMCWLSMLVLFCFALISFFFCFPGSVLVRIVLKGRGGEAERAFPCPVIK